MSYIFVLTAVIYIFINAVLSADKKGKVLLTNCETVISVKILRSVSERQETNVTVAEEVSE